jgi:hypothetical protein
MVTSTAFQLEKELSNGRIRAMRPKINLAEARELFPQAEVGAPVLFLSSEAGLNGSCLTSAKNLN